MKKKIVISALLIMCVLFIAGLVILFSAGSIGESAGNSYINNQHGEFYQDIVNRIIDSTTISCYLGGFVISLIGGSGILLSGYGLFKEEE